MKRVGFVFEKVIEIDNQGRINLAMNELREKRADVVEGSSSEDKEEKAEEVEE